MKQVYFMRPVGQLGPIKIGCSKLPELRLDTMTIWSPVRLELIVAVPGSHKDEAALHGMFRKHHLHGEWFGASKELLALIDHCSGHGALPELPQVVRFPGVRHKGFRSRAAGTARKAARRSKPLTGEKLEQAKAIADAYAGGLGLVDIAQRFEISTATARSRIRHVGGTMRQRGCGAKDKGVVDVSRAEAMAQRYNAGETLQQIADDYGITRERVRQLLRKYGVASLGRRPEHFRGPDELTPDQVEAARLYGEGVCPKELTRDYNVTYSQMLKAVERLGIEKKTKGSWLVHPDDEQRTADVTRLYQSGHSAAQIVQVLDWLKAPETVYRYLQRGGVQPRRRFTKFGLEKQAAAVIAKATSCTLKETADHFGVSITAVTNLLKRHEVVRGREIGEARRIAAVREANRRRAHQPTRKSQAVTQ